MASTSIKSTYALDVETVRALEGMARSWRVSKAEALRRAIRAAAREVSGHDAAIHALDRLQRRLGLTASGDTKWAKGVRRERRGSSLASEKRGR